MMKRIAVLVGAGLIGYWAFGINDAEAQRRGGWGGGWVGPRVVYRSGHGWRGGYGYRGGYWRGGAVLANGVHLGAAAVYPYYGYGAAYPAYGYSDGAPYPAYSYGSPYLYAAPNEIREGCRTVYGGAPGIRVPVDCGW